MTAYLIAQASGGTSLYFSPQVGRKVGAGGGWAEKADDALAFARAKDAQMYLEFHLGHLQPICSVVPREIEA